MASNKRTDAVVIGAGAVGCAIALQLARSGIAAHVVDRDGIASNASAFAWGGLSAHFGSGVPGPMTEIYRESINKHIEVYEELSPTSEIDWQLQKVTSLSLADTEESATELGNDVDWMRSEGFDVEIIDASEIRRIEPAVRGDMLAASVVNAGWELDSYSYTKAIAAEASKRGANFEHGKVEAIEIHGENVSGVTFADGSTIETTIVIVATGPWTSEIKGIPALPIKPIKGEILRLKRAGNDLHNRVGFSGFNVGRKPDGSVWAGTYEWDRGFNRQVTDEGRSHIFEGVKSYIPSLADATIETSTACLRPVAVDGFPIVGRSAVADGVFYANGAGKKGILLSLLMAEWLTHLICDETPPPDIVSPTRFPKI